MNIDNFLAKVDINKIESDEQKLGFICAKKRIYIKENGISVNIGDLLDDELDAALLKLHNDGYCTVESFFEEANPNSMPSKRPNIWYDILMEELFKRSVN